jgi:hypothetical protein
MTGDSTANERLRDLWAAGGQRSAGCPTDEEIWAASRGELPEERRSDLLGHSIGCPACAESFRMAAALGEEAGLGAGAAAGAAAPVEGPRAGRGRARFWLLGLAAAAVVVIASLVPVLRRTGSPPADEFREPGAKAIRSELDESVPLPRDRFVLRWSGAPQGALYTVEVATEDLTVIDRAEELGEAEHRVDPERLVALASGTALLWRVDAILPDASRVSSPVFRVTLR